MADWQPDLLSLLIGLAAGVLLVWMVGRLRQPVGRVWTRLRKRIQGARRRVSAGAEGRHREELAAFACCHHLGRYAADLDQVFVAPRLILPPPEPTLDAPTDQHLAYVWPELAPFSALASPPTIALEEVLTRTTRAVIVGPAGGGKTTALAYLALCLARGELGGQVPDQLPVYFHFEELEWETVGIENVLAAGKILDKAAAGRTGSLMPDLVPAVFNEALAAGKALLLIDGWDELTQDQRALATRWLKLISDSFPGNQYLLAAPLQGYGPLLELGFVPLTLAPWRPADAGELVERWSAALGVTPPTVRASQEPGAPDVPLLDFWRPGMTPLEATLSLWLRLAGEETPPSRTRLMHESVVQLLAPLDSREANWPARIGEEVYGLVAQEMVRSGQSSLPWKKFGDLVREVLGQQGEFDRQIVQNCIQALGETGGLLVHWQQQMVRFASPAFTAYFWAYQTAGTPEPVDLTGRLDDPEWAPALRHWAALHNPVSTVEHLLDAQPRDMRDPLFIIASWSADLTVDESLKRRILMRLAQLMVNRKAPLAIRKRAAAALVQTQDSGVSYLLRQAAQSGDPTLGALVAPVLGALALEYPGATGDDQALQALIELLNGPHKAAQVAAAHALARTGVPAATQALIALLMSGDPEVRQEIARAFAGMGNEGEQILREALEEDEVLTRRAALHGLAALPDEWVTEQLRSVQHDDPEWFVRSTAEDLLNERLQKSTRRRLCSPQPENLGWLVSWAAEHDEGVPAGPAATAALQRVLQEADLPAVRAAAALSLGNLGRHQFSKLLRAAWRDPAPEVREAAFFAFALIRRAWPAGSQR